MNHFKTFLLLLSLLTIPYLSAQDSSKYNMSVGINNLNLEFGIEFLITGTEVKLALEGASPWGLKSNVFPFLLNSNSIQHKFGISAGANYYYSEFESGLVKFVFRAPIQNKKRISFYIGPIYEIAWKDFFFNTSIGIGNNNYKYPRLSFSVGYNF